MPGISYLGTLRKPSPSMAEAIGQFAGGVGEAMVNVPLMKRKLEMEEAKLKIEREKIRPYEKEQALKAVNLIMEALPKLTPENQAKLLSQQKVRDLFDEVGIGIPEGVEFAAERREWKPTSPEELEEEAYRGERGKWRAAKEYGGAGWTPPPWLSRIIGTFGGGGTTPQQRYPTKQYMGHTYEKREDGKWHLVR